MHTARLYSKKWEKGKRGIKREIKQSDFEVMASTGPIGCSMSQIGSAHVPHDSFRLEKF